MTSAEIRQSFLDYFKEKQHTIVPSSSLMPDAPNLLFTNAGMNQFVPIFLAQEPCPYKPGRAADTQKCIRAGGKHNDLEDVGLDTYHHTFFEMLGNWSFGDYFKKEAIEFAWELLVKRWKFPPARLYATVYQPGEGDPSEFDEEAASVWRALFKEAGLDPEVHIVKGNKKDNFWMMGDTGPCGPCSELHVDLTPEGDSKGKLVNTGDARCIEIWNLVFIQFNAKPDGTFEPLPARHVDTGMGFERVCSIIQGTKDFSDFASAKISNYETDVFRPLFDEISRLSGKEYGATLPAAGATEFSEKERADIAFRVIADHIRTLCFAIADGIQPSNEGRGYVLRRILRRAVRYGRSNLGMEKPFLNQLVGVVTAEFGRQFPELVDRRTTVEKTIRGEEESFSATLDRGLALFTEAKQKLGDKKNFPGDVAFELYDTYGFPLDLTELLAREAGLKVDQEAFDKLMTEQRERSKAAQKKEIIEVSTTSADGEKKELEPTKFVGFEKLELENVKVVATGPDYFVTEETPFYAEMGGQVGDTGIAKLLGLEVIIKDTVKGANGLFLHKSSDLRGMQIGDKVTLSVDAPRRRLIQAHHSATHIMNWALRKTLGDSVGQKGSYVGPDRLRFDFSQSEAVKTEELAEVEKLVNQHINEREAVDWYERPYTDVKGDKGIIQAFGEKYGERVRVVDIGGYSRELCGGTHVRKSDEIGFFKIISEGAIAAGVRRIEAVSGTSLIVHCEKELGKQKERYEALLRKKADLPALKAWTSPETARQAWDLFEARNKQLDEFDELVRENEKLLQKAEKAAIQSRAAHIALALLAPSDVCVAEIKEGDARILQAIVDAMKPKFEGVIVLGGDGGGRASLIASVGGKYAGKLQAGKIIQEIAPIVGGKGGGRPELAQGGGPDVHRLGEALDKARELAAKS